MREPSDTNYLYLNREGRWPGFRHHGLERRADGALQLATVPLLSGTLPDAVKAAPIPDGPAGVASDSLGTLYFSDPGKHRLTRIDGCDGSVAPVPCLGAGTGAPTSVRYPRGLWISPARPSLFVADSGNHRVQIFDLDTLQLVAIWGQANPGATPRPGSQPGQFDTPWSLAGDGSGNVYVVDYGNRRVQKFNAVGDVLPSFWNNVRASGLLQYPSDVAVREYDGTNWVFVVDAASSKIFVFDGDGQPVPGAYGRARAIVDDHLTRPMGVAAAGDALYVGDNDARRVLRFHIGARFEYVGEAVGYTGPVAALWLDARGALWVHPGGSLAPVRLEPRGGYGTLGHLWSEQPLQVQDRTVVWHRLQAVAERLAPNAHLNLYVYGSNDPQPPESPTAANSFTDAKWRSVAYAPDLDLNDVYIGGAEARYLWIGALLSGDGVVTPMLRQLRVEFDHASYDQYLPAIYRPEGPDGDFVVRLLSLFESLLTGVEDEIASLPALFDPHAAPQRFLAWLAGCLGLEIDENWDAAQQRRIIADAFASFARRGTAAGLRESLRVFAGVDATIEEPLLNAAWWALPSAATSCCTSCGESSAARGSEWHETRNSILGSTTMLAPAQPQGAVVGTTAVLDQSHLIAGTDFGAPLFTDVAHQFSVQVLRSQVMCRDALPRVRAILDQEKPAHTTYHLCIIEPRFRVGFQSRVGIDTVVGGPSRSLALGTGQALGQDTTLGGAAPSLLGAESRLGLTTRLA